MTGKVLILGASGRFGRHAAEAFWNAGWTVRKFDRATDELMTAAEGTDVIINGWNPPYPAWASEVPKLTAEVIGAAKASGATVLVPGNVYVYGEGSGPQLTHDTPHSAHNPLGRIRIDMEAAYKASGVRTIILRAGDFIDTEASGNWFDMIIAAKAGKGTIVAPGDPDAKHAWAYLPDLAEAAVQIVEQREKLSPFEEVLFPGYTLSLRDLAKLVEDASGEPQHVQAFNWWTLRLAAPFWPMGRKLFEMRYLWSMPHALVNDDLSALLPKLRETDPLTAIRQAIAHLDIDPDKTVTRCTSHIAAE